LDDAISLPTAGRAGADRRHCCRRDAHVGASHQTGWTGIVATFIEFFGKLDAQAVLAGGRETTFSREKERG
jgi:hypothetical protein